MQHKYKEVGFLSFPAKLLLGLLNVLLQLAYCILQGCPSVVNLINDKDVLANQVGHLERAQVQPLCSGDLGARDLLRVTATEILVKRQADSLDGDIGVAGALQERPVEARSLDLMFSWQNRGGNPMVAYYIPKNAGRNIATTADSNHQIGVEILQDGVCRLLAKFMHLLRCQHSRTSKIYVFKSFVQHLLKMVAQNTHAHFVVIHTINAES